MNTKRALGFGVLAILAVLITLVAMHNIPGSLAALQQATSTRTPSPTLATTVTVSENTPQVITPEVTSGDVAISKQIPLCAFDTQAQPALPALSLDSYTFSEPEVVLTSTTAIRLLQWLPDNRRLLISRAMIGKAGDYIEIFNLETGEIERYAEWWGGGGIPVWLPSEQAVAFVNCAAPDYTRELLLARGQNSPVEELATDLATPLLSLSSDGQRIVFSSSVQGVRSLQFQQTLTSELLVTGLPEQIGAKWPYLDAWRADGTKVVMHKRGMFYLVDQETEAICEINLGSIGGQKVWAMNAKWSPDGRYIAALTIVGEPPFRIINLTVIDTIAGEVRNVDFDGRSVQSINWSPSNNILLVTIDANPDPSLGSFDSLYLVDVITYSFRPILPEHQFFAAGYFGALWSSDGKSIGVSCSEVLPPDEVIEWRICTATVETLR